jgi:hypothetical protein
MTTPALTPISSSYASVRYFTQGDPYHYTVDNRPLTDLSTNDTLTAQAADAGRRVGLLNSLFEAVRYENRLGTTKYVEGLLASNPGANTLRVGVGAVYEALAITTSDARTITKKSVLPAAVDFTINTVSLSGAQSVVYAIEMKYVDFSATTSTIYPLYDKDNTHLHSAVLFGDLQLQVVAGNAATTGSETPPSTTPGWTQLYYVTVDGSAPTTYKWIKYATGFTFNSWGLDAVPLTLTNLGAGGSTSSSVDDVPTTHFADGSTQTCGSAIPLVKGGQLVATYNPYKPVKFRVRYSSTVSSNNVAFRVSYAFIRSTSAINSVSYSNLTQDAIAAGTADQLQVITLTNGAVPASGGIDQNTYETLRVRFARIGADGADTNTGVMRVFSIEAFQ